MSKLKTETQLPQTIVMPSAFVLKKCTCCNLEFPKTETYFRKNGLFFRSKCKNCLNKNLPKKTNEEKKEAKRKSHKLWQEKNRIERNKKQKEYRCKNLDKYKDRVVKYNRKTTHSLTDDYILSLLCKRSGVEKETITKEIIEQKRIIIQLKRQINYGQAKGLKF